MVVLFFFGGLYLRHSRPTAPLAVVEFSDTTTRGEAETVWIRRGIGSPRYQVGRIQVRVKHSALPHFPEYGARVVSMNGTVRWEQRGLHPQPDGAVSVLVNSDRLARGPHIFKLEGLGEGKPKLIVQYYFKLDPY